MRSPCAGLRVAALSLSLWLGLASAVVLAADSPTEQTSSYDAWLPSAGMGFADYVQRSHVRLREVLSQAYFRNSTAPFGPGIDVDAVVDARGPYEWRPAADCRGDGQGMGFLLIHGLTDSPYLLRDVAASLRAAYPCALLRGVLLPGHGTVPADTLDMRHEDWLSITDYGVNSFRGEVEALYMVGFSTGTSLSVRYADAHRDDSLIRGLIMLSPAIEAKSAVAFLSPYVRWFRNWLSQGPEDDFARYTSFSMNAGAEFYLLTRNLSREDFVPLSVPVFMAGSGDDATVNMESAREFFCAKTPPGRRQMLWYRSATTGSDPAAYCDGLQVLSAEAPQYRVVSFSHTSLSMSPDNPHYGVAGDYPVCDSYRRDPAVFAQCVHDDAQTVYGERGLGENGRLDGKLVRRGTFNPGYTAMMAQILRFIGSNP